MKKSSLTTNVIYLIIVILVGISVYSYLSGNTQKQTESTITQIAEEVNNKNVQRINVDGNEVVAVLNDKSELKTFKEAGVGLNEYGITTDKVQIDIKDANRNAIFNSFVSVLLPFLLIGGLIWLMFRSAQGGNMKAMSFGKSSARLFTGKKKTTFGDVAGLYESKEELNEVVDFLKNAKKYKKLGAEILFLNGDLVWGNLSGSDDIKKEWEIFDKQLSVYNGWIYRTPGNHDLSTEEMSSYFTKNYSPLFFDFLYKGIHFIVFKDDFFGFQLLCRPFHSNQVQQVICLLR